MARGTRERFIHHDLGNLERGRRVLVHLSGNQANVLLLDDSNFRNYKSNRSYRYHGGGLAKSSPVVLVTPRQARWHIVVDLRGLAGRVQSNVEVVPMPLPPIRPLPQSASSEEIAEAVFIKNDPVDAQMFDVFISHASEDKDDVVRPLAENLRNLGLRVWYDEFELRVGDSLRRKIDEGIVNSRFGIVVLSPSFFGKGWTEYELDGIVASNIKGRQRLLPIWHEISSDDIAGYSPSLLDKVALTTHSTAVDEMAQKIYEAIQVRGSKNG